MGAVMEYFKNRWKEKRWLYVLDWIVDIVLAAAFIYMSWQTRLYMLNCTCPFCQSININITNTSEVIR
jgi:uncharacterized membrane protein HdeD (DUF308 family)